MIPQLENAKLVTDLDFNGLALKNSGAWTPVPPAFVDIDDPRFSDARLILDGTVTDDSVNAAAEIDQSKLNLNGSIPPAWLGSSAGQAASGPLVTRTSQKNANSGYPGLDVNGRVLSTRLPSTGPQTGTVTKVGLSMPPEFTKPTDITAGAGSFGVAWQNQPDGSWFGVNGPVGTGPFTGIPTFLLSQLPIGLVPGIDATKFTSGEFDLELLPIAVGIGPSHAKGLVPDPGDGVKTGHFDDYLGRDMTWKTMTFITPYQPTLPDTQITFQDWFNGEARILILQPQDGASIFYQVINPLALPPLIPPFLLADSNPFTVFVPPDSYIQAYSAKTGWNNSDMNKFTAPEPPETT